MVNWAGKRVAITGAGGFIGSHLAEALVEAGAIVRAMVHYNALGSYSWLEASPQRDNMEILAGDIADRDSVKRLVGSSEIVFHLAALIAIPYSYHAPASYVRTNIEGTLNVLQAARDANVERLIHTSTSEVYGTARYTPIDENHPLQGQSPYSATKIGADKLVESFYLSFGVPAVTVRPFNTFGPRQSARAIIPTIITQCLTGDVVKLGNLHPTRDLNYVTNTAEGFMLAAGTPEAIGKTINLGTGSEISMKELAQMIIALTGNRAIIQTDEQRLRPEGSEVERLVADITLAQGLLNWQPRISLEAGLSRTIEWIQHNLERYKPHVYNV
jgi:dTDP-glucose 4,6-dehydratase